MCEFSTLSTINLWLLNMYKEPYKVYHIKPQGRNYWYTEGVVLPLTFVASFSLSNLYNMLGMMWHDLWLDRHEKILVDLRHQLGKTPEKRKKILIMIIFISF